MALRLIAEAAIRASGRRNFLDRRIWIAISQEDWSISAQLNESSNARASISSCSLMSALARTSIFITGLIYSSQSGKASKKSSKSKLPLRMLIMILVSSRKRDLFILILVCLYRIGVPWITVFPFIPHSIDIFNVVSPGVVFPCAISSPKGMAEIFIIALTISFRKNSIVYLRVFQWKLNDYPGFPFRNCLRYIKGNPAAGWNFNNLFNGHIHTIPYKNIVNKENQT